MSGDRRRGSLQNLVRTRIGSMQTIPPIIETDCFQCEEPIDVGDVRCWIGDTLTWDKPLFQSCSIPLTLWFSGGLNCHLWGNQYGPEFPDCGTIISAGGTAVKFHSVDIAPFAGVNLLQRKPGAACEWRKRHVKLLQQVYHDANTTIDPDTGAVTGYPSVHEDIITYPYTDPVDASDQWAPIVWPTPATSPAYPYPVIDERCYTSFGPWPATGPGRGPIWQCENSSVANVMQLSIVRLAHYLGNPDNELLYDPRGERYWELKLIAPQTYAANTNLVTTGAMGLAGVISGSVSPYGGRLGASAVFDPRNPAVDLSACPPYYKITEGSYCRYGPSSNQLFSGYDSTILRWIKKVDCNTDFEGNPLILALAIPRPFVDSIANPQCSNKHINAEKFGLTGYSETAVLELLYD